MIRFGKQKIPYRLTFSARRHLKIYVFPDGRVAVDAPEERNLAEVEHAVKKRVPWIVRQRAYFERFQPLPAPRRYVSGETHRYLGGQYRIQVRQGSSPSVKLAGRYLWVFTPDPSNPVRVRAQVQS